MSWSAAEHKQLEQLAKRNMSGAEIGKHLGKTRNAVIGHAWRTGVKLSGVNPGKSYETPAHIRAQAVMDAGSSTYADVAQRYGVSRGAIIHWVRQS